MASDTPLQISSPRIAELDALRGIAAVGVMLYHYLHRYGSLYGHRDPLWFTIDHHTFGIPMFFMLSGYVITMILQKPQRPLDFVFSRFSRLFPAYWACLLLTFIGVHWWGLEGRESSLEALSWNVLMFQQFLGKGFVDGAYWTLSVELSFYAWMLLLLVTRQLKRVEWLIALWLALSFWNAFFRRDMGINLDDRLEIFLLFDYAHYFAAGILVYRLRHQGITAARLLLFGMCFGFVAEIYKHPNDAIALFGMGLFLIAVFRKLPILASRPLVFVGTISYPFYLLHQNLGYIAIRELSLRGVNSNLAIILTMVLVGAAATIITYTVEKPALSFLRTIYRTRYTPNVEIAEAVA